MSIFNYSDIFARSRCSDISEHRAHACRDAGVRAKQEPEPRTAVGIKYMRIRPGWRTSTELMYRMYSMPISPKAPTFGAGAKIGAGEIAEKDNK